MYILKCSLLCLLATLSIACNAQVNKPSITQLKQESVTGLLVPEPSDASLTPDGKTLFIVSDDGILFECNPDGSIIRRAPYEATDYEAVYADDSTVYVVDERTRLIHFYKRASLVHFRTVEINYNGGRNKGFEWQTI
jgi:hypothetical protein